MDPSSRSSLSFPALQHLPFDQKKLSPPQIRKYRGAICRWLEQAELTKAPQEQATFCVNIGRAYSEIGEHANAIEYGQKALKFAEEVNVFKCVRACVHACVECNAVQCSAVQCSAM